MSFSSSGYMDGVPVKISEQYKPPRRIILPQNVFQRINSISEGLAASDYDVSFEQNVLQKVREWRLTKEREILGRKDRLNQIEEAEKKAFLEKDAVENEERRKQLTEVSYPSTDDLSELSSEGDLAVSDSPPDHTVVSSVRADSKQIHYQNNPLPNHDSILQPQLVHTVNNISHIHNHQPLQNSIGCQIHQINYSDFENDTSSPFDNMELKTINDIELLAQVLSNTQIKQPATESNETNQYAKECVNYTPNDNVTMANLAEYKNNFVADSQPISNENYAGVINFIGNTKITNKMPNGYYNQFSYNYPVSTSYVNYNTYNQPNDYNNYPVLYDNSQMSYFNSNKAFNHQMNQHSSNIPDPPQNTPPPYPSSSSSPHQKSKSRSVPDIVKELEDELSQAKDIVSKRSQNASPSPNAKTFPEYSRNTKQMRVKCISESKNSVEEILDNPYKDLSPKMQQLAFHISQMGFPLPRTARVCIALGDDDKKIIEHLLAMDQLLDLGFSEKKITEALLKSNNDRDKALDFLIT